LLGTHLLQDVEGWRARVSAIVAGRAVRFEEERAILRVRGTCQAEEPERNEEKGFQINVPESRPRGSRCWE
jgi:hypothetical protein